MILRRGCRPDWTEVCMGHCFLGGQSVLETSLAFSSFTVHLRLMNATYLVIVPQ